MPSSSIFYLLK